MRGDVIKNTEEYVKAYLGKAESGHNWWHIYRVRNLALYIQRKEERGDLFIIELAALLHDIGDYKTGIEGDGKLIVKDFLKDQKVTGKEISLVLEIMENISFRDSFDSNKKKSVELAIVQDADRLDAMGAIGIARAFNYGGFRGNEIYDPDTPCKEYRTKEEYTSSGSPTINHFYEKLLKLKSMMNTDTAKALAVERHVYMQQFLDYFFREWRLGEDIREK